MFRTDLLNAKIPPEGLDLHSLRYTANTTMLASGLNPAIIRARMEHSSSAMTDLYTDQRLIGDNHDTSAVAHLLGLPTEATSPAVSSQVPPVPPPPSLHDDQTLHPPPEVLAGLAERYTNGLIGAFCLVSEAAVRKWLERGRRDTQRQDAADRRPARMADCALTGGPSQGVVRIGPTFTDLISNSKCHSHRRE